MRRLILVAIFMVITAVTACAGGEKTPSEQTASAPGPTPATVGERPAVSESGDRGARRPGQSASSKDADKAPAAGDAAAGFEPTASVSALDLDQPDFVAAETLLLNAADVPSGFSVAEQGSFDDRVAAREWSDPDKWLENYRTWGMTEAAKVEFRKGTLKDSIESSAEVYESKDGARDAFKKQRKETKDEMQKDLEVLGAKILILKENEGPHIGDENSLLIHARASVLILGTPASLDFVGVVFRRGNVVASVGWTSLDTNILRDDVVQLAMKQDLQIQAPGYGVGVKQELMPTGSRDLHAHVPEDQSVVYNTIPPTSGDHWAITARCGFYEDGLPDGRIVHNLEHSNIVVSYNLAAEEEVDQLRDVMDGIGLSEIWGVTRFYDEIPVGTVAVAAWGVLDTMQGIDGERIKRFFNIYAAAMGPEAFICP